MKFRMTFMLIVFLYSCDASVNQEKKTALNEILSQIENYNKELEQIIDSSSIKLDTASINTEFDKAELQYIDAITLRQIYDDIRFQNLLSTERDLLIRWDAVPNFRGYSNINPDTLLKILRRCATIDRAPDYAERVPSA